MQRFLPPKFRDLYLVQSDSPINHSKHFNDLNELNGAFLEAVEKVAQYKLDIAQILQMFVESYCSVFIQQYQTFYSMKSEEQARVDKEVAKLKK